MAGGPRYGNPVVGTNRPAESKPRDRVLRTTSCGRFGGDSVMTNSETLFDCEPSGERREEIGNLEWSEVDMANGELRFAPDRTKNGRLHVLSLSDAARAIIATQPRRLNRNLVFGEGQGGFGGWGHSKRALDQRMAAGRRAKDKSKPMAPWRIHDIRRTVATRMADIGIAPHVIEAVLNHVSGSKAGVAGVYNRSSYAPKLRSRYGPIMSDLLLRNQSARFCRCAHEFDVLAAIEMARAGILSRCCFVSPPSSLSAPAYGGGRGGEIAWRPQLTARQTHASQLTRNFRSLLILRAFRKKREGNSQISS